MAKADMIVIRTNGDALVGLGHIRRCLTLARALDEAGATVRFVIDDDPTAKELVTDSGFNAAGIDPARDPAATAGHLRSSAANVLIGDSYRLTPEFWQVMRPNTGLLVAIDDLADRELPVDIIINGAQGAENLKYRCAATTQLLLGSSYILLREEFAIHPERASRKNIERVLITVGGMDPSGITSKLVRWTRQALEQVTIDVVVGPFFEPVVESELQAIAAADRKVALHRNPVGMRDLMLACDLAVTGGGQTTYELAASGTPALAMRLFANQSMNLAGLESEGSLVTVGEIEAADIRQRLVGALREMASEGGFERRGQMSRAGRRLIDGCGARRVARAIVAAAGAHQSAG